MASLPSSDTDENEFQTYMREIREYPRLTQEEEIRLGKEILNKGPREKEAILILIERNLRLVVPIAKRYLGQGLDILDLIQEGNLGLMDAAKSYDYTIARFSTHATWLIRQGVRRGVLKTGKLIPIPEYLEDLKVRYKQGKTPITDAELRKILSLPSTESLEAWRTTQDADEMDSIEDPSAQDPETAALREFQKEELFELFISAGLTPVQIDILVRHFGLRESIPETFASIAKPLYLCREAVSQREKVTLRKLRAYVAATYSKEDRQDLLLSS